MTSGAPKVVIFSMKSRLFTELNDNQGNQQKSRALRGFFVDRAPFIK
jgi:hypothetical protein